MKTTIEIYLGSPLTIESEKQFLQHLSCDLGERGESALILANFFVGKRRIDFLIVTSKCASHVELKNYTAPVIGRRNGLWKLRMPDGEELTIERENPYIQALDGKYDVSDSMDEYATKSSVPRPSHGVKFWKLIESVICVYPELLPGSQLPSDYKVWTKGYPAFVEFLVTRVRNPGWSRADWLGFAMHLGLTKQTDIEQESLPSAAAAKKTIDEYKERFKEFYGSALPVLVPTSVKTGAKQIKTDELLTYLSTGRHGSLIGGSGTGKSHLAKHMMLDALERGWLPILLKAQTFDGKLSSLLNRSVAHLHPATATDLLTAATQSNTPVVLVVDGYNECPEKLQSSLLEVLQAFYLRRPSPILFTAQTSITLPKKIAGEEFAMENLTADEKQSIFRAYSKNPIYEERAKLLMEAFATAYEISIAAECITELGPITTRFELFDAYVRKRLHAVSKSSIARKILSEIAYEMADQFVTSLPTWQAVGTAEGVIAEERVSLRLIDELIGTGVLDVSQNFWTFRHELIGQFFSSLTFERKLSNPSLLAPELARPRNRNLAEFVISFQTSPSVIRDCLEALADARVISAALKGNMGNAVQQVAESEAARMFQKINNKLNVLQLDLKFPNEQSSRSWPVLQIANGCDWSAYETALMSAIGLWLCEGRFVSDFVSLVEQLERIKHGVISNANDERVERVDIDGLLFQTFYIDQYVERRPQVATSIILNTARLNTWRSASLPTPTVLLELLKNLDHQCLGTLYLLCILLPMYRDADAIQAALPQLLERCWKTGIYHLQLEAIHLIGNSGYSIADRYREQIKEILPSLISDNIILNSSVMELLLEFGLVEPITDLDTARAEIAAILSTPDYVESQERAHGAVSNIFEEMFGGVYDEAIDELSRDQKIQLYTMAALGAPAYSFSADFILGRLFKFNDSKTATAFQRWASEIDIDTAFVQVTVRCFELAMKGCARFMSAPPQLKQQESSHLRAWQLYGEIIFWMNKPDLTGNEIGAICRPLWDKLSSDLVFEAVDPLMHLQRSDRRVSPKDGLTKALFPTFREPIRKILERALSDLDGLSSAFIRYNSYGMPELARFVVTALGEIGDSRTCELLQPLIDSTHLGSLAVESIRKIKSNQVMLKVS